jgi:hypothetical protein
MDARDASPELPNVQAFHVPLSQPNRTRVDGLWMRRPPD